MRDKNDDYTAMMKRIVKVDVDKRLKRRKDKKPKPLTPEQKAGG